MAKGLIFEIKKFALHDGPGIRTTVFLQGCNASCWWCHNPEGNSIAQGKAKKGIDFMMREDELGTGREVSVDELMQEIMKDRIFYETSNGGVTFSGGEPLMQYIFLEEIIDKCKEHDLHVALDTSGYAPKEVFNLLTEKVDLYLYDLKLIDEDLHKKYTGVSNYYVLENLKTLDKKEKETFIRFPVIPGITATQDNIAQLKEFVSSLNTIKHVDLLPYHKTAGHKYDKLGIENKMKGIEPPTDEEMQVLKKEFQDYGFKVRIGG
jgi:pyruvate formate lyase activating enzyme